MGSARRFAAVLLVAITSSARAQQPARPAVDLTSVDAVVAAMMTEWHVPGLALGVIKDRRVVYAKGYGYRDVESKAPVTPRTVMAIGSNSKSFTAVLLGMLADEKKLDWDTPVRTYLADFQLHDDYATKHLTPRDLVNLRSGLPRHDVAWYGRKVTREELFRRLRYLEPTTSFRNTWQYQNLMFMTAGYLEERLTGQSWDQLIRDRIFAPLGMTRSNTSVTDIPKADDFAHAYTWSEVGLARIPYRNLDHVAPAGSINSSVEDMLKYVQFRIDLGAAGGKQLLSAAQARLMEMPQMVMGSDSPWGEGIDNATYGLGVATGWFRGHRMVLHGGGIDGFISQMSWLPDDRIGVVVLTNQGTNNPIPTMVVQAVYDRILSLDPIDWTAKQREADKKTAQGAAEAAAKLAADRKPGTSPTRPLSAMVGSYQHPGYGTLVIRVNGSELELIADEMRATLEHYHYDVFKVRPGPQSVMLQGLVSFSANIKGDIDRVAIALEPSLPPVVLTRVP